MSRNEAPKLSVFRERVRCVPYLLPRKRHRCHRNDKEAHFVGNRRAFRAFLVELNFSRFAARTCVCYSHPLFIGVSSMPTSNARVFLVILVNVDTVVSKLSRVFLVILLEHSEEIRGDLETIQAAFRESVRCTSERADKARSEATESQRPASCKSLTLRL